MQEYERNVIARRLFEQEIVDKTSRASRPMGHRFTNGQAAEGDGEEEDDQDDDNPLRKLLFLHLTLLLSP
jgi:hypothetical protein